MRLNLIFLLIKMCYCSVFNLMENGRRVLNVTASSEESKNADVTIGVGASVIAVVVGLIVFIIKKFDEEKKEDTETAVTLNRLETIVKDIASKVQQAEEEKLNPQKNLAYQNTEAINIALNPDHLINKDNNYYYVPEPKQFRRSSPRRNTHRKAVKNVFTPIKSARRKKMLSHAEPIINLPRIESNSEENLDDEEDFRKELSLMHREMALSFCEDPECDCKFMRYNNKKKFNDF